MDATGTQYNFTEGMDVVGSDGGKVGEVVAAHRNYIVVEKGFFFPTDYYIPTSAIASADDEKVYLNVTKDEALDQGWDTAPAEDTFTDTSVGTGYATDTGMTGGTGDAGLTGSTTDTYAAGTTTDTYATQATETSRVDDTGRISVPVHEEELTATKRGVERGEVRISKDVVSEERTMEVPTTEERVRVSRVAVDRDATADDTAFQEGTIEVPVRGEEVDLQKRVRVAEEVEVEKEAVQRTQTVGGTVRREEVYVDDATVESGGTRTTGTTTRTGSTSTDTERRDGGEGLIDRAGDAVRNATN